MRQGVMGRREVEFEVERRREDRTPVRETEPADSDSEDEETSGGDGAGSKSSSFSKWMENPRTMENMSYFVIAQTFVLVLSYGLPQIIKFWHAIKGFF